MTVNPRREPAVIVGLVAAAIEVATSFGLNLTDRQNAAIIAFVTVAAGFVIRSRVTPTKKRRKPQTVALPFPQDADEQEKQARRSHFVAVDSDMFRSGMNGSAARERDRHTANARRLAEGLPAWNFRLARPVPPVIPPTG